VFFLQFLAAVHILYVNCADKAEVRLGLGQSANSKCQSCRASHDLDFSMSFIRRLGQRLSDTFKPVKNLESFNVFTNVLKL